MISCQSALRYVLGGGELDFYTSCILMKVYVKGNLNRTDRMVLFLVIIYVLDFNLVMLSSWVILFVDTEEMLIQVIPGAWTSIHIC